MSTAPQEMNLATLPPPARAALALKSDSAEQELRALVERTAEVKNVVDKNGRDEAHRAGMSVKNARVSIEKTAKAAREDAKAFQGAVIAEERRLIEIVAVEEARLFKLRDDFDDEQRRIEEERQRLAAERAASIATALQSIRDLPAVHAGAASAVLGEVLTDLALREVAEAEFGDKVHEAKTLIDTTASALIVLRDAAVAREEKAEADRLEVERLRAEAAEAKRKADELEAQRLREEQDRREELERSTRAQAESMAAARLQRERMNEILRVQNLGLTIADARGIDAALEAARAFDPSDFGEMEPMAANAKSLAVSTLEQRMRTVLDLEIPSVIDEAYAIDADINAARDAVSIAHLVPIHEIDWDEPPTAPVAAQPMMIARIVGLPDADSSLAEFRRCLTILRGFYPDAEVVEFFNDEMAVMAGRY